MRVGDLERALVGVQEAVEAGQRVARGRKDMRLVLAVDLDLDAAHRGGRRAAVVQARLAAGQVGLAKQNAGHTHSQARSSLLGQRNGQDQRLAGAGEAHVQQADLLGLLFFQARELGQVDKVRDLHLGAKVVGQLARVVAHVLGGQGAQDLAAFKLTAQDAGGRAGVAPALPHRHDGKLQALRGVDRHDAHGVALAAREHRRVGLGNLEPQVELHAGAGYAQAQVMRKVAQVAHGGQEVGRARAALSALVLKAQQPARLDQRGAHDVCQLPGAHAREGAVQHLEGAGQARRGLDARRHRGFQDARVDAALAIGLELFLPAGAQGAKIVGVQPKHVAGQQAKEALLGVVDVCQGVHQRAHDLDLV